MIRIAFTLIGGANWTGGHNYLRNLLTALSSYTDRVTPVLFVAEEIEPSQVADFSEMANVELVQTALLNPDRRRLSLIQSVLRGRDSALQALFGAQKVDVVFEAAEFFGWRLGFPAVAWIPDFQHRALPSLFTRANWWKREIGFRMQIAGRRIIMLSSEDSRQDCELHYPITRGRTRAVRFAVSPGVSMPYSQALNAAEKYCLPEKFFYLPNQFWKHKNHGLVIEALALLRARASDIVIVASGKTVDPRTPSYFADFEAHLKHTGLQGSFRLLGLIPFDDVRALMRACTALLNPSLFEGWSTTVEEARALGTPMLLSDLAVHMEQMGSEATYFDRYSARALADALENFSPLDNRTREQRSVLARDDASRRMVQFARDFLGVIEMCRGSDVQG